MARTLQHVEQPNAPRRGRPATGNSSGGKTPRKRFLELAPDRVTKAVEAIRFLEKLGNPAVYSYTADDKEQIFNALEKAVDGVRFVLNNPGKAPPVVSFDED
jgi:hypothetical protein